MKSLSILACVLIGAVTCQAQQTPDQLVRGNLRFFEHLLEAASGPHGQVQSDHYGLNSAEGKVLMGIAQQFKLQENALEKQFYTALEQKDTATMAQIRAQRAQLLIDSAVQLMQQLDADGASRIANRVAASNRIGPVLPDVPPTVP